MQFLRGEQKRFLKNYEIIELRNLFRITILLSASLGLVKNILSLKDTPLNVVEFKFKYTKLSRHCQILSAYINLIETFAYTQRTYMLNNILLSEKCVVLILYLCCRAAEIFFSI